MARPFDASRLTFAGEQIQLVEGIDVSAPPGFASVAIAETGVLAYTTGVMTAQDVARGVGTRMSAPRTATARPCRKPDSLQLTLTY